MCFMALGCPGADTIKLHDGKLTAVLLSSNQVAHHNISGCPEGFLDSNNPIREKGKVNRVPPMPLLLSVLRQRSLQRRILI
jgi:hypothetical protein